MIVLIVAAIVLAIAVLVLTMYGLSIRGILRSAIIAADGYAPGGRDHVRVPYNLACRWAFHHGENFPYKKYTQTRGVHIPEESFR